MKPLFGLVLLFLFACSKSKIVDNSFSEARYSVTITGRWASPDFTVPANAHFTTFGGMIHNGAASLWKPGEWASTGTEQMAESGVLAGWLRNIDSMVAAKNALSLLVFYGPSPAGSVIHHFSCNSNYSRVSFGSMLGPTPDWFVGISGIDLYRNGQWIKDTLVNLYPYDAGTEDGDMFGYNNPASIPQQNIHLLQVNEATILANGNAVFQPIATARFILE